MSEPAAKDALAYERVQLGGAEPVFLRWTPERAQDFPELVSAVAAFDPGERPAAQAAAEWLRSRALNVPPESVTRLCVARWELLGFYAIANGAVSLRSKDRKSMGVRYGTQPAVIVTWMAKRAEGDFDGGLLVDHAIAVALHAARTSAATVIALDPYDEGTAELWRTRYGFRNSLEPAPGRELKRMFLPLDFA